MNGNYRLKYAALGAAVSLVAVAVAMPAWAQKAQDTLRVGAYQPISIIDGIYDPQPQTNLMDRVVFDTLVAYDSDKREVRSEPGGILEVYRFNDSRIQTTPGREISRRFGLRRRRCRIYG